MFVPATLCLLKTDHFTKTGSGQTSEKLRIKGVLFCVLFCVLLCFVLLQDGMTRVVYSLEEARAVIDTTNFMARKSGSGNFSPRSQR